MATTTRIVRVGNGGDVTSLSVGEAMMPADTTAAGTNEIWKFKIMPGQIPDLRVDITGTVMDSSHYMEVCGENQRDTISMYGSKYGGAVAGATFPLRISGAAAYVVISDLALSASESGTGCIIVTGSAATVICRRVSIIGGDRNSSLFQNQGASAYLRCESCIGFYSGDSTGVASFRATSGTLVCINCISVGARFAGFVRQGNNTIARAINCFAFSGGGFYGGWSLTHCFSHVTTANQSAIYGGGGAWVTGGATISGGVLDVDADGEAVAYSTGAVSEVPRVSGAIVSDVTWNGASGADDEAVIDLNPNATEGASANQNRVVVRRAPGGAIGVIVYTDGASGTTRTGDTINSAGRRVITSYWDSWNGGAGAGSLGIGVNGAAPTATAGLTVTRGNTGVLGEMTLCNVHDGGRLRAINGQMHWNVMFGTNTPTVNGNVYDLKGAYVTADLKADLDVEYAAYAILAAASPLDHTIVMGNGDVVCFHDFASNSADMLYRKNHAALCGNGHLTTEAAAVVARMNPYLLFSFDPADPSGLMPGRRFPGWKSSTVANGYVQNNVTGDCVVTAEGLTATTGRYNGNEPVGSGKNYGGTDRSLLCWVRVINGPAADTQRGFAHVRESAVTNNCWALSTTATGEFTARYTNGAGTATVATSVAKLSSLADGLHLIRATLSQATLLLSIYIDGVLDGTADATGKANQSNGPAATVTLGCYNDGSDRLLGPNLRIERAYITGNLLDITEALPVFSDLYGLQDNLMPQQKSPLRRGGVVLDGYIDIGATMDRQGIGNNPQYVPIGPCAGQRTLISCG